MRGRLVALSIVCLVLVVYLTVAATADVAVQKNSGNDKNIAQPETAVEEAVPTAGISIPEPLTMVIVGGGLVALAARKRRRKVV